MAEEKDQKTADSSEKPALKAAGPDHHPSPESPSSESPAPEKTARTTKDMAGREKLHWAVKTLILLVLFLLGAGSSLYFLPQIKDRLPFVANWVGSATTSSPVFQTRLDAYETRLRELEDLTRSLEQGRATAAPQTGHDPALAILVERLENLEEIAAKAASEDADQTTMANQENMAKNMALSARIDMLLGRMSQLESSFVPLSRGLSDAQEARTERAELNRLSQKRAHLLEQVEGRLENLEAFMARDSSGALINFRLSQLRQNFTAGKSFILPLGRLEKLISKGALVNEAGLMENLRWLENHQQGLASKSRLREDFNQLIPALIRAKGSHENDPWWKAAYFGLRNLVTLRKTRQTAGENTDEITGEIADETLDGVIITVEKHLQAGQLHAAVKTLKTRPEAARAPLKQWIDQAMRHLEAEEKITRMEDFITAFYLKPSQIQQPLKQPEETLPQPEKIPAQPEENKGGLL